MTTKITIVNGVDGLTPDMLRQRPKTNFWEYEMSLEAKKIAEEIVKLEKMQADGLNEYEVIVMESQVRPIGPRLRELHKQLDETGKGPKR